MMKNKYLYILSFFLLLTGCSSDDRSQQPGNNSNVQNNATFSAEDLRTASLQGDLNMIQQILEEGIDVEEADQLGRTALMFASFNGHTEIVEFLIEQGADTQKQNSEGRTPLMFASSGPFPETVELLLENGVEPNVKDSVEGWTALMYAAAEGNREVIEVLLDYNADITLEDADGETALDFARNNGHSGAVSLLEN